MIQTRPYFLLGLLLILAGIGSAFSCGKSEDNPPVDPGDTIIDSVVKKRDVETWITMPDKSFLLRKQVQALSFGSGNNTYPSIVIDTTQVFQSMDGFGFAMTGGSAYVLNKLPVDQKEAIMHELFSSDSGCIHLSYLRISIGASDLDATVFSYNDIPVNETDEDLSEFTIARDRENLIPILKLALKYNPELKIMGSPWSAPVWMKTNKKSVGGSLKTEYYDVYAQYFVKYIQEMAKEGITIDAITPQNEPLNPNNNPSMYMTSDEQKVFIRDYLGPAFATNSISTKIVLYDHNCDHPEYATQILDDPEAKKYIDGSAFHLYGGDISALSQVHSRHPDKNVYFTEQWVGGPSNFGPDMQWHVKNLIIGATRNWSKSVIEWNLASDPYYKPHTDGGCTNCEGALTVYLSVSRNVSYYIIAHASKFVETGSERIGSSMPSGLPNVAFKTPDGHKVLIVLNEKTSGQSFNIKNGSRTATAYLDSGAVATFVWK